MAREQFIVAIQYHKSFGYILKPFRASYNSQTNAWTITHNFAGTGDKIKDNNSNESRIVQLAGEYDEEKIFSMFNRSSKSKNQQPLSGTFLQNHILPFIQKKMYEIIEILKQSDIPLLLREEQKINQPITRSVRINPEHAGVLFHFIRKTDGIYYNIRFQYAHNVHKLKDRSYILLSEKPCAIVIEDELYTFPDINGKKLQPFFSKEHIFVPKRLEEQYCKGFVKKVVRDYDVNAEGFGIYKYHPHPRPCLTLSEDISTNTALKLSFRYLNHDILHSGKRQNLVFYHENHDEKYYEKIFRDFQQEKNAAETLKEHELNTRDGVYYNFPGSDLQDIKLIDWLNRNYEKLKDAGFIISRDTNTTTYHVGPVQLETSFTEKDNDWFDIYAVVKIDDHEIPFIYFREHILQSKRIYKLPDGKHFVLPEEWFSQYKDLMNYAAKGTSDHIVLKKHHYGLLMHNSITPEHAIPEQLIKLYTSHPEKDIPSPPGIKATLRNYQKEGYAWLYHLHQQGFGGCLADDMGLGKTIQALSLLIKTQQETRNQSTGNKNGHQLSLFQEPQHYSKPSLVIMPTSLLHNWEQEIKAFAPSCRTLVYAGNRNGLISKFPAYDIILTSYGLARIDLEYLKTCSFFYIILDESQYVKNPNSKTYQAVNALQSNHRLVLTGTPVENSLTDLWAQLNFLNNGLLGDYENFTEHFVNPIEKKKDEQQEQKLEQMIRPFLLRRKKQDVAADLPPLTEQTIYCEMTEDQYKKYKKYKSAFRNQLIDNLMDNNLEENRIQILEALLRMRQMANHPVLAEPGYQGESGKFNEIIRFIESLVSGKQKTIFFSSFTAHLSLLADYLNQQQYSYAMLTGQTHNRKNEVKKFQENDDVSFFLVSLKAGGTGLNLTAAGYVFLLDPWWNPAAELQALNRAHRIGQDRNVFVYKLIARSSIEEKIYKLQQKKAELADTFINSNNPFKHMNAEQVKALFD